MNAVDYLSGAGGEVAGKCHVPDLVPSNRTAELVFVFESSHVDELKARLPVVGAAGRSALRFLSPGQPKGLGLGRYVQERHAAGDGCIAVLNVSNVPMQAAVFVDAEGPVLAEGEWTLIERVRRSNARSISGMRGAGTRKIAEVLVEGLRKRLAVVATDPNCRVVAAGYSLSGWLAPPFPI